MQQAVLQKITEELKRYPFLRAVVLGGSRSTGTASDASDYDIGLYYDAPTIDYDALNRAAARLDDGRREGLICRAGEWGRWVNAGGWLTVDGCPVDLLLRDMARVTAILESTERGAFSSHYQTGHPHAFLDVMYRGELASCRVLYARDDGFLQAKRRAEAYPAALRGALIANFLFEANFSCMLARKNLGNGDLSYLCGHLFRSVSALNQVLFALNGAWCLNEKKAALRAASFGLCPVRYAERVNRIFLQPGADPGTSIALLGELCRETEELCRKAGF